MEGKAPQRISTADAIAQAYEQEMDLVEINPNSVPPMVKIMDYGKYLYKKRKLEQDAKKGQKQTELKTIRFGFNTSEHDLSIKEKKIREFIEKGNIVKIQVQGRGRELAYKDLALKKVEKFIENIKDVATVDTLPKLTGHSILTVLKPTKTS